MPTAAERRLLHAALRLVAKRDETSAAWLKSNLFGESGPGLDDETLAELVNLALAPRWPREYLEGNFPEGCTICSRSIQPMEIMAIGPAGGLAHDQCAPASDLVPRPLTASEALAVLKAELTPSQ